MIQFVPKKAYLGLGKPWKAWIFLRVCVAVSVSGVKKEADLSNFWVKVAFWSS